MTTSTRSIAVIHQDEQFQAAPFGGAFHANKPVVGGRSADGQISSATFYWSHSRFNQNFEFGLHHHEGFEIATFILEGTNSHYDTATRTWVDLVAGDVQLIRSGSGISHNERVAKGTRAFQIWWDPGYQRAVRKQPSYTDYPGTTFQQHQDGDAAFTHYIGGGGPIEAETEGLSVRRIELAARATSRIDLDPDRFAIGYVISGSGSINGTNITENDAVSFNDTVTSSITAADAVDLFVVSVPTHPSYEPVRQS